MMAHPRSSDGFCIRLLGDLRIQSPQVTDDLHISGKTREVFAFLLFNANKTIHRATLSNLIWADHDGRRSRANLNTALWRINRALTMLANHNICLNVSGNRLKLTVEPCVCIDVFALGASVRDAGKSFNDNKTALLPLAIRDTLMDILSEGCENFLQGTDSEWVLIERERFFNLQIRGLTLLMQDLAESGRIGAALNYGRRILRMDPMRECVQRQVMWLHILDGHQANAIRQYLACARILETELGVSPMAETRALYEFIVAQNIAAKDAASGWSGTTRPPTPHALECGNGNVETDDYDQELTRLRSLIFRLNSHRQSVFSALAENGAG